MNTNVNLGGGEALFALIPASGISEALTVNVSNNAVMDVNKAEALLSSNPVISMSQQSALKVNNPDAMDCDNEMGVGTAKVEGTGPTYEKLYSSDPWTIEGWCTVWQEYFVMDKCERGLDGQCLILDTSDKQLCREHILTAEDLQPLMTSYTQPFSMNLIKTTFNLMIIARGQSRWFCIDISSEMLPVNVTKTFLGVVLHHIGNNYWVILMMNIHDKCIYLLDSVKHDGWQKQHGDIMKSYRAMSDKSADPKKKWEYRSFDPVPKYSSVNSSMFCALFAWLLITQTILSATDAPFWKSNITEAAFRLELIHFLKHVNTMP
ncbi:hypothetical protein ARMGADRAFT_1090085 [Armillaria gallica]|uniref:Ubiquitin-like protease family profile domain-containing protein n=1 Tax=Armillaria gallica TaxID=47427 RepID=A0A2H3CMN4_ARMGA|nr:hypothetical protein ARMGADRAFT_1090085 [Armillaria gallica]